MKRRLLTLAAVIIPAVTMMAQSFLPLQQHEAVLERNTRAGGQTMTAMAPRPITLADDQQVLGSYDTDDYVANLQQSAGLPRYPGQLTIANVFTADDLEPFFGSTITSMRVAMSIAQELITFVIVAVDEEGNLSTVFQKAKKAVKAGWNEVDLDVPYTIEREKVAMLLLGFTYTQVDTNDGQYYDDACYPLSITSNGTKVYDLMVKGVSGSTGWASIGAGNLSVQAIVRGSFATNAVAAYDYGSLLVPFGQSNTTTVRLRNLGSAGITDIDYTISSDGTEGDEQHYTLPTKFTQFNGYPSFDITMQSADTEGTQQRVVTITKVNGQPNEAIAQAQAVGLVASTSKSATAHVTVEEYTGTGCGWCPRGLIGMEKLRKELGDRFVGIGLHQYNSGDPMYITDYTTLDFSGAPSCTINRQLYTDPYYGSGNKGIVGTCQAMLEQPCMADISVEGAWTADGKQVEATAEVTSLIEGADFNVEFVLVGDGLTGTANSWKQANYYSSAYSGSTGMTQSQLPGDLKFLWTAGASYAPLFNDVALTSSVSRGVNSVAPLMGVLSTTPSQASCTLTLPTKQPLASAIQTDEVYVVALLVNPADGTIINAAKSKVGSANGLKAITASAAAAPSRYALDGTRLSSPRKGVNIMRTDDGRTVKVVVR